MSLRKHTKVFTAFSFLRLRSPDLTWFQWIYPSVIFLAIVAAFNVPFVYMISVDVTDLVSDLNNLLGVLIGFYIAALAAISSFSSENLDKMMKGRAPILVSHRQGERKEEALTRRRFLATLFGYCAAASIVLFLFGAIRGRIEPAPIEAWWVESVYLVANHFFWGLYVWLASSLLIVTLLGLHYLVERMHRT